MFPTHTILKSIPPAYTKTRNYPHSYHKGRSMYTYTVALTTRPGPAHILKTLPSISNQHVMIQTGPKKFSNVESMTRLLLISTVNTHNTAKNITVVDTPFHAEKDCRATDH